MGVLGVEEKCISV